MLRYTSIAMAVMMSLFLFSCNKSEDASLKNSDGLTVEAEKTGPNSQTSKDAAAGKNAVRIAPAAIVDWHGFQQPMVAATMFIPYGWEAEGGIAWGQQYACTNGYAYNWRAKSKDDTQGVVILPQQRWEWNAAGKPGKIGCSIANIDSVATYIDTILREVRSDARIVKQYPRKDLEQQYAQLNSESETGFQYTRTRLHAGEALIEFSENGTDMRGIVTAAVLFTYIRTGGGNYGVTVENYIGYALPTYVAYAPAPVFNPAFFDGLRRSFTPDPQWEKAISGHNTTIDRINREGIMKRAEITRQTADEIRELNQQAWDRQQRSADRRLREFSEYIRDVETYDDPQSDLGQVELDSGYAHAWRLDDGTYVLTNDHMFNPAKTTGQFGEKLKVTP